MLQISIHFQAKYIHKHKTFEKNITKVGFVFVLIVHRRIQKYFVSEKTLDIHKLQKLDER